MNLFYGNKKDLTFVQSCWGMTTVEMLSVPLIMLLGRLVSNRDSSVLPVIGGPATVVELEPICKN